MRNEECRAAGYLFLVLLLYMEFALRGAVESREPRMTRIERMGTDFSSSYNAQSAGSMAGMKKYIRFFCEYQEKSYLCRCKYIKRIKNDMITIPGISPEMIANNLTPAFPTHPGEILKEEIEYRGISQRKLAQNMGIQYSVLNEILNARRPVTEKTALLFEAALGIDAEPLMRLQLKYNMQTARKDTSFMERLAQVRKVAALL